MKNQLFLWKTAKKSERRKESSIWHVNKDFCLKSKESNNEEVYKNGVSKTRKSIRKVTKTQSAN